jgi:hypothetical protein
MMHHGRIGFLTVLALTLVLGTGMIAPVAAQPPSDQVVISATVVNVLDVQFPADVDFGTLPAVWYPDPDLSGGFMLTRPGALVVTSSLPYAIHQTGHDESVGPVYDDDFVLFWQTGPDSGYYFKAFAPGIVQTIPWDGGFEPGYANVHDYTFILNVYGSAMPLPAGTIRYVATFTVTQV